MKHDIQLYQLIKFLESQNIKLDDRQIDQLQLYYDAIISWNDKINLVSKGDILFIIEKHFFASFYYVYQLLKESVTKNDKILDLGSGSGLPGILISIYFKNNTIVLLDSSRKKTLFLRHVVKILDLKNEIICERAEKLNLSLHNKFEIVVARAVATIPKLIKWVRPLITDHGSLYTLKGMNYKEEYDPSDLLGVNIQELPINENWINFSSYLKNKIMLKMEF